MSILIFGAGGQVGTALRRAACDRGVQVFGVGRVLADLTDFSAIRQAVEAFAGVQTVVNAAAFTAVDAAETHADEARTINADAPGVIAEACAALGLPLIHLSTDYVFGGAARSAYTEACPPGPLNMYGKTKLAGEAAVAGALSEHIILRSAWLYSAHHPNFVHAIYRALARGRPIEVVADQRGSPTSADALATAILDVTTQIARGGFDRWGLYHFASQTEDNKGISRYELARAIGELGAAQGRLTRAHLSRANIKPVATQPAPGVAERPAFSVLDCTKIQTTLGIKPTPWRDQLAPVIAGLARVTREPALNEGGLV